MKLIKLQSNDLYKIKVSVTGTSVIKFYKKKDKHFPDVADHLKRVHFQVCIDDDKAVGEGFDHLTNY